MLTNSPDSPRKLNVELTTLCNLNCSMCVKQSPGWDCPDDLMPRQTFQSLAPLFKSLDTLNLNGVGESLMHPELPAFIAFARARVPQTCVIGFQSNGMLLTPSLARELSQAGLDRICFSVDSPDAEQLRRYRAGAELGTVGEAFTMMRKAAGRPSARPLSLGAETVVNSQNHSRLPDMISWCADHGAQFVIVSNVLPYSAGDAAHSLFEAVSQRCLDFYEEWAKVFRAEGMNISDSYRAYYTVFRTSGQKKQVEIMLAMLDEARRRNLEFSLPGVMQVDFARMERARESFARCAEIAASLGVRLELPELTAREPRQCHFVQSPSLFVAADGTLTPCYYLWHSYSTWQAGTEVRVRQRAFGKVPEDNPLAAWNSEEFVRFREEAAQEEYARCGDCSVTPCDYVQGIPAPFSKDCYGVAVPCGICPWSGGGFSCLR
jgi:putative metalloenzyme radical SAM/SPASM domain maturase